MTALALALLVAAILWPPRRLPQRAEAPAFVPKPIDEAMVVDLASALVSAGSAIPTALQALGSSLPPGEEANDALRASRSLLMGASWEEAWEGSSGRLSRLASALEPAWVDGAPPVVMLHRSAAGIRARRLKDSQEAAARLGVRLMLPLGLCFLPAFFLIGVAPVIISMGMKVFG